LDIRRGSKRPEDAEGGGKIPSAAEGVEKFRLEVKWTARPRPVDARHLEIFLDEFSQRAKRGFIICRCERPEQLTERVRAIPWRAL
jgi:hypothetical protein